MTKQPERLHEYRNHHLDSTRWDHFHVRDDDIVVTTAYKAGTTWTQRILAALIHGPDAEVTDLMLLASRQEDADTLFFHRRLQLTGDVELGLTVRNLLDQLPWETLPAPLRLVLEQAARIAGAVRDARNDPPVRQPD